MPTACRAEAAFPDIARASELGTCPQLSLVGEHGGPGDLSRQPFTSSQTPRGADIMGLGFYSDLPTLHMTVSVQGLLGLTSAFHHFQVYPVSSTRGCSLSVPLPLSPKRLAPSPIKAYFTCHSLCWYPQQSHSLLLLRPQCPCHPPPRRYSTVVHLCIFSPISWDVTWL